MSVQLLQLGFEFGQFAVLDLGGAIKLALACLLFGFEAQSFNPLLQLAHAGDGIAFCGPARAQGVDFLLELGQLLFDRRHTLEAVLVGLALEGRALNFERGGLAFELIDLGRHGTDLDGEPWANPPSMGCDEVVMSDFVGSLSVGLAGFRPGQTNVLVNRAAFFRGSISGRASYITWSFGDGPTFTNLDIGSIHQWTNAGNYTVTFTAYNNDNPAGVSTNIIFPVLPLNIPQLQSARLLTNGFQFQFAGQGSANYTIQCATNLMPPVSWQALQTIYNNAADVVQITDPTWTNAARFYRVLAQ